MRFPQLKYPRICRLTPYIVVVGCAAVPIGVVACLPMPDLLRAFLIIGILIGLLVYMIKNFAVLMGLDIFLSLLCCERTARKQYTLPARRSAEAIRHSVLRYGKQCQPLSEAPQPSALRYKATSSMTVYCRGIERVLAAYEVEQLDLNTYFNILRTGKSNSAALTGRKKLLLTDPSQKKAPLHRVTVILILAHRVDPKLAEGLYDRVCKQCGDEDENCTLPCVVDLSRGICTFNSLRVPYVGFSYAAKNRGIRIIKKCVFGGNWNLYHSPDLVHMAADQDPERSLWDLWKEVLCTMADSDKDIHRQFEAMDTKTIHLDEDSLFLKWDEQGILQEILRDPESKTVKVAQVTNWFHPVDRPISKKTIGEMCGYITSYFEKQGYTVKFVDPEEIWEDLP